MMGICLFSARNSHEHRLPLQVPPLTNNVRARFELPTFRTAIVWLIVNLEVVLAERFGDDRAPDVDGFVG